MHDAVFYLAVVWMTLLLGAGAFRVIHARGAPARILAVDMVVLILVGLLVLFSSANRTSLYLDAALLLAVLSFVTTVAASRFHAEGRIF